MGYSTKATASQSASPTKQAEARAVKIVRAPALSRSGLTPTGLLETLARLQLRNARTGLTSKLWSWHRTTAWRRVCEVMRAAEVSGPAATPKGLRHSFGIAALTATVPLMMIQKWLGHSSILTTAIYLDASGTEERRIAFRMWQWELRPAP